MPVSACRAGRSTWGAVLAALAFIAGSAAATTFVPVADEALVAQAPLIALVRVDEVRSGPGPLTDYAVSVEDVFKGTASHSLVVRVPGGGPAHGPRLRIWGAPAFGAGDRALLFLEARGDGAYRVLHLALGAFHVVEVDGEELAVRDLAETREVQAAPGGRFRSSPAGPDRPRSLERFRGWIQDRAAGGRRAADYFVALEPAQARRLRRLVEEFTIFEFEGVLLRWFEFDTAGSVVWRAHTSGQSGVAGGGFNQFQTALAAWNADPATPVNLTYGGKTGATTGFTDTDGFNTILFNDPNDELGSFSCASGGILAIGGPWFDPDSTGVFKGDTYIRIIEAEIITNNGLSCFFADSPDAGKAAEELFAHELGHGLGLGHSCDEDGTTEPPSCSTSEAVDDALMRWLVHDDERGAALQSDDRAGLAALYQQTSAPAAPTGLTATTVSTTEIEIAWNDNATNETEYRVELRTLGGEFTEIGVVPANTTSGTAVGLAPATGYVFRVRAGNASGFSPYSNEASATTSAPIAPCVPGAQTLCLNGGRFQVEVDWQTTEGATGPGTVVSSSDDSGLLWFFNADNWEMLVKVLDGCTLNDHYWVFFAATTDVQFVVTVIDTANGTVVTYFNPLGHSADAVTDTSAFATCL